MAFCEEKNIPYVHFPTIADNLNACVSHLMDMGENETPKSVVLTKSKM